MNTPIDYDLLFQKFAKELRYLTPEQVALAQTTQKKLANLSLFHPFGKVCLELELVSQEQSIDILEAIQSTCKLKEKPVLNVFLLPPNLASQILAKLQQNKLLSKSQLDRCQSLQKKLRVFGIERHLTELALEEKYVTRSQIEVLFTDASEDEPIEETKGLLEEDTFGSVLNVISKETPFLDLLGPDTQNTEGQTVANSSLISLARPKTLGPDDLTQLHTLEEQSKSQTQQETVDSSEEESEENTLAQISEERRVIDDYEILHEVSRGGMGIIYKARQQKLDRIVALKVLKAGENSSSNLVERFSLEAKAVAQLSHPNILPIYDFGMVEKNPYFTMEFVDGLSLRELLKGQKLSSRQVMRVVISVAKALQHSHEKGYCHRDIKPANIMIDKNNRVFLMDFGLVKNFNKDLDLTNPGAMMGTPAYMSPEQVDAKKFGEVGICADIYALGAVFYEMLTTIRPFSDMAPPKANAVTTALLIIGSALKPPSHYNKDISPKLEKICMKCLEKKQEDRYQSVEELLKDLESWLKEQSPTSKSLPPFSLGNKATSPESSTNFFNTNKKASNILFKRPPPKQQTKSKTFSNLSSASSQSEDSFSKSDTSRIRSVFPKIPDFEFRTKIHQDLLGDLFIAHQKSIGRSVQVRIVPKKIYIVSQAQTNPLFKTYFDQVQKLSRIYHPQLLPFLDFDSCGENFYFIRPFIRGKTLAEHLQQKDLSFYRKVDIFLGLASVLLCLQKEEIVYLDFMPENILLGVEGELKLLDSSIGRERFHFMSPEEAQGKLPSSFSDQFSLGLVMFYLFSEQPLIPLEFEKDHCFTFLKNYKGIASSEKKQFILEMGQSKNVALKMMSLLEKCLAPNPKERFENLEQLMEQLEHIKIMLLVETINKMPVATRIQKGIPVKSFVQVRWHQFIFSLSFCLFLIFLGIYPFFDRVRSREIYLELKNILLRYFG